MKADTVAKGSGRLALTAPPDAVAADTLTVNEPDVLTDFVLMQVVEVPGTKVGDANAQLTALLPVPDVVILYGEVRVVLPVFVIV